MLKPLLRTLFINTLVNDRNLQNVGFIFCIEPALKRLYSSHKEYLERLKSYSEYFSSNPFFFPLILGLCINLERKGKSEMVQKLKVETMSPVSALSDALIWSTLKPAFTIFFCTLAFAGWIGAPFWFWLLFFLITNFFRIYTFFAGLNMGLAVVYNLSKLKLRAIISILKIASLIFFGGSSFLLFFSEFLKIDKISDAGVDNIILIFYFLANALFIGRLRREINFFIFISIFVILYYIKNFTGIFL